MAQVRIIRSIGNGLLKKGEKMGELNLVIYGRCLSLQKTGSSSFNPGCGKYPSSQTGDKRSLCACFKWNNGHCNKILRLQTHML